jgi:serine/threonine-protein kinase
LQPASSTLPVATSREEADRYELVSELATGGMATVYLGRLRGPHGFARTVAVKVMHPQYAKDPSFHEMFLDEARLTARIRHPNVVPTLDIVSERGELLIVMEYVEGESLSSLLRACRASDKRIPAPIVAAILHDVLSGLHAAHETKGDDGESLGIIHRDVSPQNVLVGTDGLTRVLDFGVAKARGRVHNTNDGEIKGKVPYMPPEQLYGEDIDRTVDVYAAGVVAWEALTAQRLFDGPNEAVIMRGITDEPVPTPGSIVEGLSPAFDALVMRAISRDKNERFATAQEMATALEECGPIATRRAVAAFVKELAGEKLDERSRIVRAFESGKSQARSAPHLRSLEAVLTRATRPDRPVSSSPDLPDVPSVASDVIPRDRSRFVVGLALLVASLGALLLFVIVRSPTPSAPMGTATGSSAASSLGLKPPPGSSAEPSVAVAPNAAPSAVPSSAPSAGAPSGSSSGASGMVAPSSTASIGTPPVVPKAPNKPKPGDKLEKPAAPAASSKGETCKPPYTVDAEGHRHYKVECL